MLSSKLNNYFALNWKTKISFELSTSDGNIPISQKYHRNTILFFFKQNLEKCICIFNVKFLFKKSQIMISDQEKPKFKIVKD